MLSITSAKTAHVMAHPLFFFHPNPLAIPRRVHLPRFTSLSLLSNNRPIAMRLLTLLACPSLRSLDFGMPKMGLDPSFILDFFSRPNPPPPLRSLSLTGQEPFVGAVQDTGHDTLRNLFSLLGGLEKLDLRAPFVDSEILRLLVLPREEAQESGQHPLLPSLKEINMAWHGTSELIEQLAEELVFSRYTAIGGTNLEEVLLSFPGFFRLQERERVKACVDRGLVLNYL
ncbi:hypothetical protein SCHPADRAFT_162401 [Schizopora paradoxa]|uniref:F-box domain-containing protein n=1 Tax=Schizopora paradoxa TaxID=27342 RepID=A0A0H2SK51_9AGAM|nr:hypothetical protein SCHPADRAFT_162401 [Schizopora paradoxa]